MSLNEIAVVIGMPRAGTTWLYENLKKHPDICVSAYKEINRYLLGLSDGEYLRRFQHCTNKIKIDISPLYFFDKDALEDIEKHHDKVILVVREPSGWIESLNNQIKKYGGNIDDMVSSKKYIFELDRGKTVPFNFGTYKHLNYIREIKSIFGDKLLVLDFSMLQNEPVSLLRTIEVFLGIGRHFMENNIEIEKINSSEQRISRLYSWLLRTGILHRIIPIVLETFPKGMVHRLRKYFVYGK